MEENRLTEYIPLKNDLLFHMVFTRNMAALKALLSALLNIPEASIRQIEILDPMQYSEAMESKLTILDLKVHLNDGAYILVEMQVRRFAYWTNRTVAYACRQVADQIHLGFDYDKLEPVIQISIMDHSLFPEHKRFFARYTPRDEEGYPYTDKLRFYVLDLTQIEAATEEQREQGLVEWARAFKATSWAEVNEIENTGVKEAAKTMEFILANPTERDLIRMRQDAENDWITMIRAAEREGEAKGKAEGEAKGEAKGKTEGKNEVARNMKRKGFHPTVISELCGLNLEEVNAL